MFFILCQGESLVEIVCSNENEFDLTLGGNRLQRGRALQLHSILIGYSRLIKHKFSLDMTSNNYKSCLNLPQKGSSSRVAKYMIPRPGDLSA